MKRFEESWNEILRITEVENRDSYVEMDIRLKDSQNNGYLYFPDVGFDTINYVWDDCEENYFYGFFVDPENKVIYKVWYKVPEEDPEDWQNYLETVDYENPDACAVVDWDIDDPDIGELRIPGIDGAYFM